MKREKLKRMMKMNIIRHILPSDEIIPSAAYRVWINGKEIFVHQCPAASFCTLSAEGKLEVEIEALFDFSAFRIRPLSRQIDFRVQERKIRLTLNGPGKLSIEPDGDIRNPLFLLINPLETDSVNPDAPGVKYFTGGRVYHAGLIELHAGETLYIEEGAFVYGNVVAKHADGVRIMGRGILCGYQLDLKKESPSHQMIRIIESENVLLEGITLLGGPSWHAVPIACKNVTIRDMNIITFKGTGDGIDLVGTEEATVNNCFVRAMDDCIAIKAVGYMDDAGCKNVRNIRVSGCVFWNAEWGNAIEIGFETRAEEIRDIVFEDIDVIRAEFEGFQSGGTFTIHNGDRACVSNILYQNIRVEDSREKLIDMKILFSQYSRDQERGQIRDITLRDISIVDGPFPVSIIRGYDAAHMINNITIENLTVHGKKIENAMDAKMVVELSRNVTFK